MSDPEAVRRMFSTISPRYDLLNHLLSLGLDVSWRRKAVRILAPSPGDVVLDLCGGTGDLALEAARAGARVVCLDFSGPMLALAARKFRRLGDKPGRPDRDEQRGSVAAEPARRSGQAFDTQPTLPPPRPVMGDALRLPFPGRAFDSVMVGFGVRNLRSLEEGFDEILRVLRPGGKTCILEFSAPSGTLAGLYEFYLARVLPRAGDFMSGRRGPYGYLASSIRKFPAGDALRLLMQQRGFEEVRWTPLTGGIAAVHIGLRPG